MEIRNVTREDLEKALAEVNKKYEGNICFYRCDCIGRTRQGQEKFSVRLWTDSVEKAGHRVGVSSLMGYGNKRRLRSACWHVHGDFFDALLNIKEDALIVTASSRIFKNQFGQTEGNWSDYNIGSMMRPVYASEACAC